MKNFPRARFLGCTLLGTTVGVAACTSLWPLAPKPGGEDAAIGEGGTADGQSPFDGTIMTENDPGEHTGSAGDNGVDAAGAPLPVFPYPSVSIAEGIGFGCHIDGQGNVWCWGNNTY